MVSAGRPAGPVLTGAVDIDLMAVPNRPAGPVHTGVVDIDLMTVPKLFKNVPENVPIAQRRERYTNVTCEGLTRHEARRAPPGSGRTTKIRHYLLFGNRKMPPCNRQKKLNFQISKNLLS